MAYYYGWAPYVPVAERRRRALTKISRMRKKGVDIQPVEINGRQIAKTFWGQAWCDHMESLGDYENRLPRGRTYVRNGSVCHLKIEKGQVTALVSGSSLYNVQVKIGTLPKTKWNAVRSRCSGQIGSLLELLQGRLSDSVMEVVTDPSGGLFPLAKEIKLGCSCPDWAVMCKHVAAVLYGIGARLDQQPELLFLLRGLDHEELVDALPQRAIGRATQRGGRRRTLAGQDLSDVFGIEMESDPAGEPSPETTPSRPAKKRTRKKTTARNVGGGKKKVATRSPARKKKRAVGKSTSASTTATKRKTAKKTAQKTAARKKTRPSRPK